ncbi:MAG TPA: ABC transporter ATP-binding protein, partial [Acetobacteraceae bacterium]|nr:ABC transporter ATP-binding protein [Acetobacteraceae bacterium]
ILPRAGRITAGRIRINGQDLSALGGTALRQLRARQVSMVFQDPARALNPTLTIGRQMAEAYEVLGLPRAEGEARAASMLWRVRIAAPQRVMASYPHQLSGGQQQRVLIAMALAKRPALLVLDEPTTGLDATMEAEVLDLIASLRSELGTALFLISHNLGIVGRMCERVGVLYAGTLVEEGPAERLFAGPRHPYTRGLLRCLPGAGRRKEQGRLETIPGFPPAPGRWIAGCVFAERCFLADARCRAEAPPRRDFGGHVALCHLAERVAGPSSMGPSSMGPSPMGPSPMAVEAGAAPAPPAHRPPLLETEDLSKTYRAGGRAVHALAGVSLALGRGEILGLVGESGSGKTTLARLLLGLTEPDAGGTIRLDGDPLAARARLRSAAARKALQIVFQNPDSALNRAHTVRHLIGRVLGRLGGFKGRERELRLAGLLAAVRLEKRHLGQRPRQLSGGLKQRVAIARAFAGDPRIVICDEPTSALDVSVQAAILNLLADLQRERQASYVFISHDLGVVRYLADRIAVLYLGRLMEYGPAEEVFGGPHHPYTEALLSAMPMLGAERGRIRLEGEIPSPTAPPPGCVFHTRCPRKLGTICEREEPALDRFGEHAIRCHIPRALLPRAAMARESV